MNPDRQPRHLAAILYADVVGFSRMSEADEEGTFLKVRDYLDNFAQTIRSNNGEVIKYAGDAVLAIFSSATDALICAAQVHVSTAERNQPLPDEDKVRFRIGLNLGDIIKDRGDVFGDGVNVAARLEALAKPGAICVSGSFYDAIAMKLPFEFEFMGEQQVKNISKPIRAYHAYLIEGANLPDHNALPHKSNRNMITSTTRLATVGFILLVASISIFMYLYSPPVNHAEKNTDKGLEPVKIHKQQKSTVLILPFKNLSDREDQEYFADGITEDLITDLSQLAGLRVLARHTSNQYKGQSIDHNIIKSELGVSHILEGSVRKSGNKIRVTTHLIDTSTGRPIWGERYDRQLDDIFVVQDDVTKNIISALSLHLSDKEKSILSRSQSNDIEAYDLFLQGQALSNVRSKKQNEQAQQLFYESIKLDPTYSRSYGALSIAITFAVNSHWSDNPSQDRDRALELARKAVEIDNNSPHAYWALGFTHLFRKEYEQTVAAVEKSIKIAPNYADGYGLLSLVKNYSWKAEEAIQYTQKAISLNPHYSYEYLYNLGLGNYTLGNYDLAIEHLVKATSRNPNFTWARLILAASYAAQGKIDEAEWEIEQVGFLRPNETITKIKKESAFSDHPKRQQLLKHLRAAGLPE